MVQVKTFLKVADNSGAKFVRCIKVLESVSSSGKKRVASVGDIILVSVRFCIPNKKVKKGLVFKALVVRINNKLFRKSGWVSFQDNFAILLDKKMNPLGTKIFGPMPREIKFKNYNKLALMSKFVI